MVAVRTLFVIRWGLRYEKKISRSCTSSLIVVRSYVASQPYSLSPMHLAQSVVRNHVARLVFIIETSAGIVKTILQSFKVNACLRCEGLFKVEERIPKHVWFSKSIGRSAERPSQGLRFGPVSEANWMQHWSSAELFLRALASHHCSSRPPPRSSWH